MAKIYNPVPFVVGARVPRQSHTVVGWLSCCMIGTLVPQWIVSCLHPPAGAPLIISKITVTFSALANMPFIKEHI